MINQKKLLVSHAPFVHYGSSISERSYNIILAALLAVIPGFMRYGAPAVGVVALSISTAIIWEVLMNFATKRTISVGNGNAAVIGMIFAMMLPATTPWWIIIIGTFLAVVVGKEIFGGIGANPFNPVLVSFAMIMLSWGDLIDFNAALIHYDLGFNMAYPLIAAKQLGTMAADTYSIRDLILGLQSGGIGSTFGIGIIVGGLYLIIRGFIRWEISISFLLGIFITASIFKYVQPNVYACPFFHLFTGYTLIGAFYLATEDSSSPANFIPMIIYGAGCGIMTVLIRNIGAYVDGVVFAVLLMNLINPIIDKIRPRALGKVK
ncbi:MAG: RnfABCDGE type electron transport complex subunit D [Desulfobacterales bacterium]|nr:RnfABCDGE type electron transport complex subunit D [Desulfobacterales bacterium]